MISLVTVTVGEDEQGAVPVFRHTNAVWSTIDFACEVERANRLPCPRMWKRRKQRKTYEEENRKRKHPGSHLVFLCIEIPAGGTGGAYHQTPEAARQISARS